jgi:hypothetical protein
VSSDRRLSIIAAISGLYDFVVGALLLSIPVQVAGWFGSPPPSPLVNANLNGMFLVAVAAGYLLPYRDPQRYRGYLWVMGPLLKGGGALIFVLDYLFRGSPRAFLLFAASDGLLAAVTYAALARTRDTAEFPRPARADQRPTSSDR